MRLLIRTCIGSDHVIAKSTNVIHIHHSYVTASVSVTIHSINKVSLLHLLASCFASPAFSHCKLNWRDVIPRASVPRWSRTRLGSKVREPCVALVLGLLDDLPCPVLAAWLFLHESPGAATTRTFVKTQMVPAAAIPNSVPRRLTPSARPLCGFRYVGCCVVVPFAHVNAPLGANRRYTPAVTIVMLSPSSYICRV